jgi:hypothetical protein
MDKRYTEMVPFTDPENIPETWPPSPKTAYDQHQETTQFSGYEGI